MPRVFQNLIVNLPDSRYLPLVLLGLNQALLEDSHPMLPLVLLQLKKSILMKEILTNLPKKIPKVNLIGIGVIGMANINLRLNGKLGRSI